MTSYDPRQAISGLGCALVAPTVVFGTALLADDHVPKLQAFAEFLGWITLCILIAIAISSLLRRRPGLKVAGVAAAIAFFVLAVGEAHPAAPDLVKDVFTTSLRVVGILGVIAGIWLAARARHTYRTP